MNQDPKLPQGNTSGATDLAACEPCRPGTYGNASGASACEVQVSSMGSMGCTGSKYLHAFCVWQRKCLAGLCGGKVSHANICHEQRGAQSALQIFLLGRVQEKLFTPSPEWCASVNERIAQVTFAWHAFLERAAHLGRAAVKAVPEDLRLPQSRVFRFLGPGLTIRAEAQRHLLSSAEALKEA